MECEGRKEHFQRVANMVTLVDQTATGLSEVIMGAESEQST